jgi:lactate permease
MEVDPFGNIFLSAVIAAVPILFLFWALAVKRMKGHWAAIGATSLAIGIAIGVYGMPVRHALLSTLLGSSFGLFPVCWIIVTALFIYNMSVATGEFEIIKNSLAAISDDRRIQALLIAFSFGSFIEGAAGFGTPVAITAAMLAGVGFNPLYAAGICLLANTAPVAFGAIGIPIVVNAQVSGVETMAISRMVGRTLPFLSMIIPLYLCILMAGWKKGLEAWPVCLVTGSSFAAAQFLASNYIGPLLPDIIASIVSIVCTVAFLRVWKPRESWHFPDEPPSSGKEELQYGGGRIFRAWAPFIILCLFVASWGIASVGTALDRSFSLFMNLIGFNGQTFQIPGLHNMVSDHAGIAKAALFKFNFLSSAGTAILLAWVFSIPVMGASAGQALAAAGHTLKTLRLPILTIATILGFAYIMNYSGMAVTLGLAFSSTGILFPFFAAVLGWLGVFMTGSDTSSNALFGKLQAVTAQNIGIDPVITVAANSSGGVCGKMISPQSISVATGATGMVGRESAIFRFTLKHSFILVTIVGVLAMLQTYVFTSLVPITPKAIAGAPIKARVLPGSASSAINQEGFLWLCLTLSVVVVVVVCSRLFGGEKRGATTPENEAAA